MEKENQKWKVCVRSNTFNHASYITDAMDGFTMQQTNFPFVCCIIDDASTDGEQAIITKYLDENFDYDKSGKGELYEKKMDYGTLIYARHKTNHNCYFVVILLNKNHYSDPNLKPKKRGYLSKWIDHCKYEAICEGDDYWTDEKKLQKQVTFLEEHPEFSLCFHSAFLKYEENVQKNNILENNYESLKQREYSLDEIHSTFLIPTGSAMYRSSVMQNYRWDSNYCVGDNVLWTICAIQGKIFCLGEKMSTYRINNSGWVRRHGKSRDIRISTYKKWYKHYRALRTNYPQLKCNQIYINEIKYASIITFTDIKPLKNIFKNFLNYSKQYKGRYIKSLITNFLSFIHSQIIQLTKNKHDGKS